VGKAGFPAPLSGGCALPNPPTAWRYGETRFPHTPCARAAPRKPSHGVGAWGNPVSPCPLREGQALPRVGAWGKPVSPYPSPGAAPSQTLPPRGGMGKPGFPIPPARGLRPANPLRGRGVGKPGFPTPLLECQTLPRAGVWGNPVSLYPLREGQALSNPPTGWGHGETQVSPCPCARAVPHKPS